jgi:hypothetical protein
MGWGRCFLSLGRDLLTSTLSPSPQYILQGANDGKSMDEIASTVGLPLHLRDNDALDELYGQIDWCVPCRAVSCLAFA